MLLDPFSDILRLANARSVVSGGFVAGGRWAIRFPAPTKIKFFAIVRGSAWLRVDGEKAAARVEAGDVFLISRRSFVLASAPGVSPVDAHRVFTGESRAFARIGRGDEFSLLGCHVDLDPTNGSLLVEVLPTQIHVSAASPQATVMQWLLDQLVRERSAELPGSGAASLQLAHLMFVQILRAHLAGSENHTAGWLRAVNDPRLAPALRRMHAEPGRAWQLGELARASAMSRTSFAHHFKAAAGVAPLTYLTRWRMRLAERALREADTPVAELARSLGYASESAFSHAFKRIMGAAPKRYRAAAQAKTRDRLAAAS
ncbi:AraC family transcriptional regulator [Nannocystis poenicansa]|uniref:AraC family transcriptional regulator n=1 Tax=Nannocystis punicea TaxID=2995304 RepID=A0ABY7HBZ8_9BACT|nr:AraC family transcriptional regulator [Nannocystis poenicansa]WAS96793.1 AraC family transcriptional regulator [Nannocystis poenicansa]